MISARTPKLIASATIATQLARKRNPRRIPSGSVLYICPDASGCMTTQERVCDGCGATAVAKSGKQDAVGAARLTTVRNELHNGAQGVFKGVGPTLIVAAGQARIRPSFRRQQASVAAHDLIRLTAASDP